MENTDQETIAVKYKPNQTGSERKTVVNIVAGSRAATVAVTQVSLPKGTTKLIVTVFAAVVIALGVFGAIKFWSSDDAFQLMKINYEKTARRFDLWNGKINEENNVADKNAVITALVQLKELERMENNPKFGKLNTAPVFSIKLKEYRASLSQASNSIQKELVEFKNDIVKANEKKKLKDTPELSYENDNYVIIMREKKNRVDKILELTKNGTTTGIDIEEL